MSPRPIATVRRKRRHAAPAAAPPPPPPPPKAPLTPSADRLGDATVCVTCLFRFDALERFLRSLRAKYPHVAAVVSDNSFRVPERHGREFGRLLSLCRDHRAELVSGPYDCGVSVCRNLAVAAAMTPYAVVCEEDFEVTDETDLETLLRPLRAGLADLVGGCERYPGAETYPNRRFGVTDGVYQWTARLSWGVGPSGGRQIRLGRVPRDGGDDLAGVRCRRADLVHNFYAVRVATYLASPCDPGIRVNEHLDHFVRLWQAGCRTYYTAESVVTHHSREKGEDERFLALRHRDDRHARLKANWGLSDPAVSEPWSLELVETGDQTPAPAPTPAPADDGRPNVVILTAGRTGSGLLSRMLIALGWQRNGIEDEYGEDPRLYTLDERLLRGEAVTAAERDGYLASLAEPWILKDPRLGQVWGFWRDAVVRPGRPTLLVLSTRDAAAVEASYRAKGWDPAEAAARGAAAGRAFAAWDGPKLRLRHEDVTAAGLLVDRQRAPGPPAAVQRGGLRVR